MCFNSFTGELIIQSGISDGIKGDKQLVVYFVNCQNHMRNIWNKAIAARMKSWLDDRFSEVKESFPPHLQISFELMNMHRTIDKECN